MARAGGHSFDLRIGAPAAEERSRDLPHCPVYVQILDRHEARPVARSEAFDVDGVRRLEDPGVHESISAFRNPLYSQSRTCRVWNRRSTR